MPAAVAFVFHLLYAIYHCVLGIINLSLWFIAMCAFYGILAIMRVSAVLCERKRQEAASYDGEIIRHIISGVEFYTCSS